MKTMAKNQATTAIFIDKYHPKTNGICAISIRVTYERKKKYYPLPIELTQADFDKVMGEKPRDPFKTYALRLQAFEKKAADIIKALPFFTWQSFEKQYLSNRGAKDTVTNAFAEYALLLRKQERIGTAVSYECAESSLRKFSDNTRFSDITPDFLRRYEKWMLAQENCLTTVGIYLRNLRALFNSAIEDGILSKELYPFGKKKYEIPTGKNKKKALKLNEIGNVYYNQVQAGTTAEKASDLWMFIYLCNGINVKDLCLLKYKNLKGDVLDFERAKTIRTKREVEPIRIILNEDAIKIIHKWGNKQTDKEDYIFPVLTKGLTAEREYQLIQQFTRLINDHMKKIAVNLGIESKMTTYVARHSFATILKRSGASTEYISEALGHTNVKTTQNYLGSFEDESKRELSKALTAFKTNSN